MEHRRSSSAMAYEHHQRQCAPVTRLPQPNSSAGILPDFSKPPPPFIPNCQVPPPLPPPQPPHGSSDSFPKLSPWGTNSEIRHDVPFCPRSMPEHGSFAEGYFHGLRNVVENSPSSQKVPTDELVDDREWVNHFIAYKVNKSKNVPVINKCNQPVTKLKIFEAKLCLEECQILLEDLENLERDMMDRIETANMKEWQDMCVVVATKKIHLEENMHKLSDPATVKNLNRALLNRRKKRTAMKRRRTSQKEEKMASLKRQQQLHLSIDTWLEEMQQSAEKVKLEESLKQQADSVLSDVTRKKAEARRQLALLSLLVKLRRIRVQAAVNRGEKMSMELVHIFENVIEKLQKYWSDQLKDYNLEEKGLRVMLEEATEDNSKNKKTLHQRIMSEWQKVMFGRNVNADGFYTVAEHDIEEFIKIRHEWDKLVVPSGVPMASPMPIGWVLPVKPSSEEWEKLLRVQPSRR